jgi:hypothetical protein
MGNICQGRVPCTRYSRTRRTSLPSQEVVFSPNPDSGVRIESGRGRRGHTPFEEPELARRILREVVGPANWP